MDKLEVSLSVAKDLMLLMQLWCSGVQTQQVVCMKPSDRTIVYNHFCDKKNRPKDKRRSCNTEPCSPR